MRRKATKSEIRIHRVEESVMSSVHDKVLDKFVKKGLEYTGSEDSFDFYIESLRIKAFPEMQKGFIQKSQLANMSGGRPEANMSGGRPEVYALVADARMDFQKKEGAVFKASCFGIYISNSGLICFLVLGIFAVRKEDEVEKAHEQFKKEAFTFWRNNSKLREKTFKPT